MKIIFNLANEIGSFDIKNPKNIVSKLFLQEKGYFKPFIIAFLNKLNPSFCNDILEKFSKIGEVNNDGCKSMEKIQKLLEVKNEIKEELVSELEKIEKNFESERDLITNEIKDNDEDDRKKDLNENENEKHENNIIKDNEIQVDKSISEIIKEREEIEVIDDNIKVKEDLDLNKKEIEDIDNIYSEKWCKIDKYNQFSSKGLILKSTNVKSKDELSEKIMLLIEYVVKMNNFPNNVNWDDINNVVEQDFLKYKF